MRRRMLPAALAAVSVVVLAACGTVGGGTAAAVDTNKIVLAGVAGNTSDPYWSTLMCGATTQAKKLGVELTWKAAQSPDTGLQQTNMDAALLTKPNGLLLASFQSSQFAAKVQQLGTGGTPVVAVGAPLEPDTAYQTVLSSTDMTKFAQQIADQVGTSGSVAMLGGVASTWSNNRVNPVADAVKKVAPGVTILPTEYTGFEINKASTIVSGLILAHPDLKAVYSPSGPEGQGAAAAVAQAGKAGTVKVYSWDATPANVAALKSGSITALLSGGPSRIGSAAVDNIVAYLKEHPSGGAVAKAATPTVNQETQILTKDNVDDPAMADFLYTSTCAS